MTPTKVYHIYVKEECVYNNLNHVISKEGKWLYDIKGIEEYNLDCSYQAKI